MPPGMNSRQSTPRRDDSFLPRRDDSFRSLNFTLNSSRLSAYSTKSKGNTYATIRERALLKRLLFEDTSFPASDSSLQISYKSFTQAIAWKRPHDISRRPSFIATNPGTRRVLPGTFGNSWLLPALSCLTLAPTLIQRCIPEGQAFDEKYAGIFRFRFWRYGEWVEVVVDDLLPTYNGQLMFTRNEDPNEFWLALLEKAYAKLYGSYAAIQGSVVHWALQDLTGGVTDSFIFNDNQTLMQKLLDICMARASLISATIAINGAGQKQLTNGLVTGRGYSVTGYAEIPTHNDSSAIIVRLRNPWGDDSWNGQWSANSEEWDYVDDTLKQKLGYSDTGHGEEWMPFTEFARHFTNLEFCHLPPEAWNFENKLKHRIPWKSVEAHRQWRRGFNAGGGIDSKLLSNNTQFYVELKTPCRMVISLMQKYKLFDERKDFVPCACLIFQAPKDRSTRLQMNHFMHSQQIASTGIRADRDIVRFFTLPAGCYVIVPVTSKPGIEGKFYMRIFTDDRGTVVRELDDPDNAVFTQEVEENGEDEDYLPNRQLDAETMFALHHRFMKFCNKYEEVDGYGLREILAYHHRNKSSRLLCYKVVQAPHIRRIFLSPDTCKAAITIFDRNMNGRLDYEEFMELVHKLSLWQSIFLKYSVGNGSVMDSYSLRSAFRIAGFSVSNKVLEALVLRFAAKDFMNLEGFINSVVKLHVAHQSYSKQAKTETENKKYLQELLRTAIYS